MSKKSDFIRNNAGNFLYIFIADSELKYFPEAIRQKRLEQAKYLQQVIVSWGYSQDELISDLNAGLIANYGYNGRQLIKRLAAGKDVFQKTGVGSADDTEVKASTDGYTVDPETGFPAELVQEAIAGIGSSIDVPDTSEWYQQQLKSEPFTVGNYSSVFSNETGNPIGVFNTETGTQFSAYNATTGTWSARTTTGKQKNNFWAKLCELMPWLISVVEWFFSLFGGKRASDVSANQSDGWYAPQSSSNNLGSYAGLGFIAILGLAAVYFANSDSEKGKEKKKNPNNN